MRKRSGRAPTADEIAESATRGEDVSACFTNKFTVVKPVHRVYVDLSQGMLRQLDERAARLNVSRQAVIKTLLGRALEEERVSRGRPKRKAGQMFNRRSLGAFLHDVPHDPLRYTVSPGLACAANAPKHAAFTHASGDKPGIDGALDPIRNRHRPNMPGLAD